MLKILSVFVGIVGLLLVAAACTALLNNLLSLGMLRELLSST